MWTLLGSCLAFWIIYFLIAKFTRHEIGLISTGILGVFGGIGAYFGRGDYMTLLGSVISIILIFFLVPIQVNSKRKNESNCINCKNETTKEKESHLTSLSQKTNNKNIYSGKDYKGHEKEINMKNCIDILNGFYNLGMCNGIVFNPNNEAQIILTKEAIDQLKLNIFD